MGGLDTVVVPDIWPEPKELKTKLLPVEPFNTKLLPGMLRDWIEDASYRMDNSPLARPSQLTPVFGQFRLVCDCKLLIYKSLEC